MFSGFFFLSLPQVALADSIIDVEKPTGTENKSSSPFTASANISSNYIFRGISLTLNNPAYQGQLVYTIPKIGAYGFAWGSNVDFFGQNTLEFVSGFGIAKTFKNNSFDLSLVRYDYKQSYRISYNEFLASGQWYFLTGLLGYTSNIENTGRQGTYYNLGIKLDIPADKYEILKGMVLSGGIGYYDIPNNPSLTSYCDYMLQLSKTVKNIQVSLAWTDTNGKAMVSPNLMNSKIVLTMNYNLPL